MAHSPTQALDVGSVIAETYTVEGLLGRGGMGAVFVASHVRLPGKKVAIKGATFGSMGDVASKGTGGGLVSANTHGPTKFVGPGSMDVKIEGKNVQLLSDPMLNNCGGGLTPWGTILTAEENFNQYFANIAAATVLLHPNTFGQAVLMRAMVTPSHVTLDSTTCTAVKPASARQSRSSGMVHRRQR